mmetsp:Transcript_75583/g.204039  ORF Transcript_75583/g.204039 Transcript_75583/m.204039 type:complete len:243 (-) Transcript_75583:147-875(-)
MVWLRFRTSAPSSALVAKLEAMRKQLYLAGQGKASELFVKPGGEATEAEAEKARKHGGGEKTDQRTGIEQERARKAQLKRSADDSADGSFLVESSQRSMAKSRYQEDLLINGHEGIWGSWYSTGDKRWGFACCKALEHEEACPLALPEEETGRTGQASKSSSVDADDTAPAEPGGNSSSASSSGGGQKKEDASLMDMRMFAAAERRQQKKKEQEERKLKANEAAAAKSAYLNDLLHNPADSA